MILFLLVYTLPCPGVVYYCDCYYDLMIIISTGSAQPSPYLTGGRELMQYQHYYRALHLHTAAAVGTTLIRSLQSVTRPVLQVSSV